MIRIAFITSRLSVGGEERHWLGLAKRLDKSRFCAINICLYDMGEIGRQMKEDGVKTFSHILRNKFHITAVFPLAKVLKQESVDIVLLAHQPAVLFYGILAAKIAGTKRIVTEIVTTGYIVRKFRSTIVDAILMKYVDRIIAYGNIHKKYIVQHMRLPENKVVPIPSGIDVELYRPGDKNRDLKSDLGIADDCKVVGIIARLIPLKRHDLFLKAASLVLKQYGKVTFLVIGDGPEKGHIENTIKELNLTGNVKMLGLRKDIAALNSILDISVLVSDTEGLPVSIIESMASSVPVIATNVGSIPELISDGINGYLIEPGSFEAAAEAISKLLANEEVARKMGEEGVRIARERFSIDRARSVYEEFFQTIIKE